MDCVRLPSPRSLSCCKQASRITNNQIGCFIFGYGVWLIDNFACPRLLDARKFVGTPLAFLFELHGWWHVFTSIGGYVAVAIVDLITSGEVDEDPTPEMAFPIPPVARLLSGISEKGAKKGD